MTQLLSECNGTKAREGKARSSRAAFMPAASFSALLPLNHFLTAVFKVKEKMPVAASSSRGSSKRGGAPSAGAAPSFDLASMEAIELTPGMIASLLSSVGDTASTTQEQEKEGDEASTSAAAQSPAASSSPKRSTRSKAPSKPSPSAKTVPKRPDSKANSSGTTKTTKQRTKHGTKSRKNVDEDVEDSPASRQQQDAASGVIRRTCCHCGRLFKRASDCRRHERIHTNDK